MKKYFPSWILFLPIAFLVFVTYTYASNLVSPTPSPTIPSSVSYELAYPGILPDNPLYVFKVARDVIVGFFISDPLKKAQFDLLMADKRLNAGVYLSDEKQTPKRDGQIADVVSKGENYFFDAVSEVRKAVGKNEVVSPVIGNMSLSIQKHLEVIAALEKKVDTQTKRKLQYEEFRVGQYQQEVNLLAR